MKYKNGGAVNQHKKMAMGMKMASGGKVKKMAKGGSVSSVTPRGAGAARNKACKIS